jgi:hypothetical protein
MRAMGAMMAGEEAASGRTRDLAGRRRRVVYLRHARGRALALAAARGGHGQSASAGCTDAMPCGCRMCRKQNNQRLRRGEQRVKDETPRTDNQR